MTTSDKEFIYRFQVLGSANRHPKSRKCDMPGKAGPRTNPEPNDEGERGAQSGDCGYQSRAVAGLPVKPIATNSPFGCAADALLYRNFLSYWWCPRLQTCIVQVSQRSER
jgi:hypothetical protein